MGKGRADLSRYRLRPSTNQQLPLRDLDSKLVLLSFLIALTYLAPCTRVTAAIQINCGGYSSIRSTGFSREGPVSGWPLEGLISKHNYFRRIDEKDFTAFKCRGTSNRRLRSKTGC